MMFGLDTKNVFTINHLRIVRGQAKILVVVTFERHLAYLRTMKLA